MSKNHVKKSQNFYFLSKFLTRQGNRKCFQIKICSKKNIKENNINKIILIEHATNYFIRLTLFLKTCVLKKNNKILFNYFLALFFFCLFCFCNKKKLQLRFTLRLRLRSFRFVSFEANLEDSVA